MKIVLDSNILFSDDDLNDEKINLLLQHAQRTGTSICIAEVVLREVEANFARRLQSSMSHLDRSLSLIEACTGRRPVVSTPTIDDMVGRYMEKFRHRYRLSKQTILKSSAAHLEDVIGRAVWRKRPMSDNGQQFRDALIWLSMLDLGSPQSREDVVFISANTRDFADQKKTNLHPELEQEAKSKNINLQYYSSLDEFLKAHAEPIAHITFELVESLLKNSELEDTAVNRINADPRLMARLSKIFERKYETATGEVELSNVTLSLVDHYVYPGPGANQFQILARYAGEGELWGELARWDEGREFQRRPFARETDHDWAGVTVEVQVELTLQGKELMSWKLIDISLS